MAIAGNFNFANVKNKNRLKSLKHYYSNGNFAVNNVERVAGNILPIERWGINDNSSALENAPRMTVSFVAGQITGVQNTLNYSLYDSTKGWLVMNQANNDVNANHFNKVNLSSDGHDGTIGENIIRDNDLGGNLIKRESLGSINITGTKAMRIDFNQNFLKDARTSVLNVSTAVKTKLIFLGNNKKAKVNAVFNDIAGGNRFEFKDATFLDADSDVTLDFKGANGVFAMRWALAKSVTVSTEKNAVAKKMVSGASVKVLEIIDSLNSGVFNVDSLFVTGSDGITDIVFTNAFSNTASILIDKIPDQATIHYGQIASTDSPLPQWSNTKVVFNLADNAATKTLNYQVEGNTASPLNRNQKFSLGANVENFSLLLAEGVGGTSNAPSSNIDIQSESNNLKKFTISGGNASNTKFVIETKKMGSGLNEIDATSLQGDLFSRLSPSISTFLAGGAGAHQIIAAKEGAAGTNGANSVTVDFTSSSGTANIFDTGLKNDQTTTVNLSNNVSNPSEKIKVKTLLKFHNSVQDQDNASIINVSNFGVEDKIALATYANIGGFPSSNKGLPVITHGDGTAVEVEDPIVIHNLGALGPIGGATNNIFRFTASSVDITNKEDCGTDAADCPAIAALVMNSAPVQHDALIAFLYDDATSSQHTLALIRYKIGSVAPSSVKKVVVFDGLSAASLTSVNFEFILSSVHGFKAGSGEGNSVYSLPTGFNLGNFLSTSNPPAFPLLKTGDGITPSSVGDKVVVQTIANIANVQTVDPSTNFVLCSAGSITDVEDLRAQINLTQPAQHHGALVPVLYTDDGVITLATLYFPVGEFVATAAREIAVFIDPVKSSDPQISAALEDFVGDGDNVGEGNFIFDEQLIGYSA